MSLLIDQSIKSCRENTLCEVLDIYQMVEDDRLDTDIVDWFIKRRVTLEDDGKIEVALSEDLNLESDLLTVDKLLLRQKHEEISQNRKRLKMLSNRRNQQANRNIQKSNENLQVCASNFYFFSHQSPTHSNLQVCFAT
jgi:hypothetical protein